MSDDRQDGMYCCVPPTPGLRMLTFPDGSRAGVMGLGEILDAVYGEGREASAETAEEIVERLSVKNYIAPSSRSQYRAVLLEEYRKFCESRAKEGIAQTERQRVSGEKHKKKGFFSRLLKG